MNKRLEQLHRLYHEYESLKSSFSEKERRLWAAQQAKNLGYGGISLVCQATGMSNTTIHKGLKELDNPSSHHDRIRKPGGGRKKITQKCVNAERMMMALMKPDYQEDPDSPFLWTLHNTLILAKRARIAGLDISSATVADILRHNHFNLRESKLVPRYPSSQDRDGQCRRIWKMAQKCLDRQLPLVFLDVQERQAEDCRAILEKLPQSPALLPCTLEDIPPETGWNTVGIQDDHAPFVLQALATWWQDVGRGAYLHSRKLHLVVRGYRSAGKDERSTPDPWMQGLQNIANKFNVSIRVRHLPPCTFRWNHILHKTITYSVCEGKILAVTLYAIGLSSQLPAVSSFWDTRLPQALPAWDKLNIKRDKFHPEWNYGVRKR